jgi:hypothetical protein
MTDDRFRGCGIAVLLPTPENFLKVAETLTRIGVASQQSHTLYQSCHILHKRGLYRILHFKELLFLDGRQTDISEQDYARRNTIVKLLNEWGLVSLAEPWDESRTVVPINHLKILPFGEKKHWTLVTKYSIGKVRLSI